MKHAISILICVYISIHLISGQQIKYYNKKGRERKYDKAYYKEIINKDKNDKISMTRLLMTGDTIFYGSYSSIDPEIRDGMFKIYDENGNLLFIKEYSNNKLNGNVYSFYNYGSIKCKRIYSNDSLISSKCFDEHNQEIPEIIEIVTPKFNNSDMNEFRKYVQTNLIYPQEAKSYGLSGRVLVEFKIDKKGYVKDIKIIESDNNIFNKEAIRVILTSSGMWIPSQRYGEPYEVKIVFPVIFVN